MSARTRGWAVVVALVLGLTGLVAATAPAAAHSQQIGSSPEPDDVLVAAPTEVVVEFDTPIVDMGAAVAVRSLDKQSIVTGPPTIGERSIAVPLDASAAPGTYTVAYRVVSEDGHTISDTFTYTLAGSTASASASASTSASESVMPTPPATQPAASPAASPGMADSTAAEADSGTSPLIIAAGVVLLAGLVIGGAIALRR